MSTIDLATNKVIELSKIAETVILGRGNADIQANVIVAYAISDSMSKKYRSGLMQDVADKLLALGMILDPEQTIDVFAFDHQSYDIGRVSLNNNYQYIDRNLTSRVGGDTLYAPVMKEILQSVGINIRTAMQQAAPPPVSKKGLLSRIFGSKETPPAPETLAMAIEPMVRPVYVILITDENNTDQSETEVVIRASSHYGVFWKFVGLGSEDFSLLENLEELEGCLIQNTSFSQIPKIDRLADDRLYSKLLGGFAEWLQEAQNHGLVLQTSDTGHKDIAGQYSGESK